MKQARDHLIVALDKPTFEEARQLVDLLGEQVRLYKIGSQLFTACGPVAVRYLTGLGKRVFLDLKFHDIPNTVANAVAAATALNAPGHDQLETKPDPDAGLFMCTLHTVGGEEMMRRAVVASTEAADRLEVKRPAIVGITVLTSEAKADTIRDIVLQRAAVALSAGLDGVVASTQEAALIREEFGPDFIVVTPGIRPTGGDAGDQKRVATPGEAIAQGSHYLVVGRPVVDADDPAGAAHHILKEIQLALGT